MLREFMHNHLGVENPSQEKVFLSPLIKAVPDELSHFNSARLTQKRLIHQMEPYKKTSVEPLVDYMRSIVLQTSPSLLENVTE